MKGIESSVLVSTAPSIAAKKDGQPVPFV